MNNLKLVIDGRQVGVPGGAYVLDAARKLGIEIPVMCFQDGYKPFISCMVCVVKNSKSGKFIPACSTLAEDNMEIITDSNEIRNARRAALELLLSDHVGDCEAPCQRVCPAHINIPQIIRQVSKSDFRSAAETIINSSGSSSNPCRDCKGPCEKACRRGQHDAAVSIRLLIKFVRETCHDLFREKSIETTFAGDTAEYRKRFNCSIGRLKDGEMEEFLKTVNRAPGLEPANGLEQGFMESEAVKEAGRCLHCDCRKAESCKLRQYAGTYGAQQRRYKADERASFKQVRQHANVIYEPEKCIKCGLCVRITEAGKEPFGLTFIGRGFDIRVGVPFNKSFAEALTKTAEECVKACPTSALAFEEEIKNC